ncbi:MAG: hypothetical protein ACI9MJ_000204, partial [Alphaproteobacteria bacterium]
MAANYTDEHPIAATIVLADGNRVDCGLFRNSSIAFRNHRHMMNPERVTGTTSGPDFMVIALVHPDTHWRDFRRVKSRAIFTPARLGTSPATARANVVAVVGIGVGINGRQLIKIMEIGPLAIEICRRTGIIHAGMVVGTILAGVTKTKHMPYFLAYYVVPLGRGS